MLKVHFNFLPNRISTRNNILLYRGEILVNSLKANRGKGRGFKEAGALPENVYAKGLKYASNVVVVVVDVGKQTTILIFDGIKYASMIFYLYPATSSPPKLLLSGMSMQMVRRIE